MQPLRYFILRKLFVTTEFVKERRVSTKGQGRSGLEAQKSDVFSYVGKAPEKLKGEFIEVEKGGVNNRVNLNQVLAKKYKQTTRQD